MIVTEELCLCYYSDTRKHVTDWHFLLALTHANIGADVAKENNSFRMHCTLLIRSVMIFDDGSQLKVD